jgi:DNA helicase-2/ATP-dependent DNA helicase PcrA
MLTREQRRVVEADGDFFLRACPGSGKTKAAAARAATLMARRRRVALCSYTNVGAETLGSVLRGEFGGADGPEHFVGTLHGFLLRFVLYPFSNLVGVRAGPRVPLAFPWGEVIHGGDRRHRLSIDSFRFTPEGGLVLRPGERPNWARHLDAAQIAAEVEGEVREKKRGLLRVGIVSADDSMYVSLRILQTRPDLARHVAARFDEVLLDEAQDTSELQLACLDKLKSSGRLASLVLVGDLEQSIFSFQGASAEGCRDLADTHGLRSLELAENHRSSQLICDVASHFCARSEPDRAVGPDAECAIVPEVALYQAGEATSAMSIYRARLDALGIATESAAVLARGRRLVDELNGNTHPIRIEARPWALGRACGRLSRGELLAADVSSVQMLLALCAFDVEVIDHLDEQARESLRIAAYRLLNRLPPLDGDLRAWIRGAAVALDQTARELADPPRRRSTLLLRTSELHSQHLAVDVFDVGPPGLVAQTVHDIKGQGRDAVMVVIDRPRAAGFTAQATLWGTFVDGVDVPPEEAEERRIAFVALTRARRYCLVALPDDASGRAAVEAFVRAGFARVDEPG